jgi:hypothetical protein
MLHARTNYVTGAKVGYTVRKWFGDTLDPAANAFSPAPAAPILPTTEDGKPSLGSYRATLPDSLTKDWADGIYEVNFHDMASGEAIDGYLVEMIAGDDTPTRDRPAPAPPPAPPIVPAVLNGGFASPSLPSKASSPAAPEGWVAAGPVSLATNGSPGCEGNALAPDEGQFLVLPGGSALTQVVKGWQAGTYVLYLKFAMKAASKAHSFEVRIDDRKVGAASLPRLDFSGVATAPFDVQAGDHAISFVGAAALGPQACTLIDRVDIYRKA